MAYTTAIRAEAQEMFFAGQSAARIATELKRRYPAQCKRLAEKTVLKWIATPDALTGETWLDKKNKALHLADEKRIDASADLFAQLNGALEDLVDTMQTRFTKAASDPSTNADYTAQVFLQVLSKRFDLARASTVTGIGTEGQIELFLQVLQEDPELGPVYVRRRQALLKAYRGKMREKGIEK